MSIQEICRVAECARLGEGLYSITMHAPAICAKTQVGQFVHIACGEGNLLRRPISICDWQDGKLRIVFQVKGEGTKWLAARKAGDELDVLGPLGHGFDTAALGAKPVFIGGGIGVPPMLACVKKAAGEGAQPRAVLGFRNKDAVILEDDFGAVCEAFVTTDDGSYARHGFVIDVLGELVTDATGVAACGSQADAQGHCRYRRRGGPALSGLDGGAHGLWHRRLSGVRVCAQGRERRNPVRPRLQGRAGV